MTAPADKTAKRLSAEDWFARYGLARSELPLTAAAPPRPAADRVAVRA